MATPKELLRDEFLQHPRTIAGLRHVMAFAIALFTEKHQEAIAKAAADGKTIEPKKPGGAQYDPVDTAIKACLGEAFPSASVVGEQLLTVAVGEESAVLQLLTGLGIEVSADVFSTWLSDNKAALLAQVSCIGSHCSKLAHTSTSVSLVNADAFEGDTPFLSSVTAKGRTRLSQFGNSALIPLARILFGTFNYGDKPLSLYTALVRGDRRFLDASGIPEEILDELQASTKTAPLLTERIAQVRWPMGEGDYISLSPLPSVAVLDEMALLHQRERISEALPGRYLPTTTMSVGGANPQNGGSFNAACRGEYPLYRSRLFTISQDVEARVERRLWSANWLNRISTEIAEKLDADTSQFPNHAKDAYYSKLAVAAAHQSLSYATQAIAALAQDEALLTPELVTRLSKNPVYQWARKPADAALASVVAELIFAKCVEGGAKTLKSDEDCKTRVYHGLVQALITDFTKELSA